MSEALRSQLSQHATRSFLKRCCSAGWRIVGTVEDANKNPFGPCCCCSSFSFFPSPASSAYSLSDWRWELRRLLLDSSRLSLSRSMTLLKVRSKSNFLLPVKWQWWPSEALRGLNPIRFKHIQESGYKHLRFERFFQILLLALAR